jgi:CheY-like chemotaxis protein
MKDAAMRGLPLVLVVEDEWLLRDSIAAYLRAAEWGTLEASTGEAALSVLKAGNVDVVFTDIQLGGAVTGWDVASTFRTVLPAIPIIYASGHAHRPDLAVTQSLAALLVGLIVAPSRYDPIRNLVAAHRWAALVIDAMLESGAIDATAAEKARA